MSTEFSSEDTPSSTPQLPAGAALPTDDERTWAMLAHWSIFLNLLTGFLGPVAALIVYFVHRDRSRYVAHHAMQSFVFQLITWYGGGLLIGLMWAATGLLSLLLVGLLLIPIACLVTLVVGVFPLGGLFYGGWAGLEVSQGKDFRYWLVGDLVK